MHLLFHYKFPGKRPLAQNGSHSGFESGQIGTGRNGIQGHVEKQTGPDSFQTAII
jgi:hypothetical protein